MARGTVGERGWWGAQVRQVRWQVRPVPERRTVLAWPGSTAHLRVPVSCAVLSDSLTPPLSLCWGWLRGASGLRGPPEPRRLMGPHPSLYVVPALERGRLTFAKHPSGSHLRARHLADSGAGVGSGVGAVTGPRRSCAAPRLRTLTCQSLAGFLTGTPFSKLKLRHEGALLSLNFLFYLVPLTPLLGAQFSPPAPQSIPFPQSIILPAPSTFLTPSPFLLAFPILCSSFQGSFL